jgi:Zn-dependent peptidase ImmA (M78 family)/thymidylate kinase
MIKNRTIYRVVEDWADFVLKSFESGFNFPHTAPIPIYEVAEKQLGLRCIEKRFLPGEQEISGILLQKERIIFINQDNPATRRRFSVGHEIGHFVLNTTEDNYIKGTYGVAGDEDEGIKLEKREQFANHFSAAILMPRDLISQEVVNFEVIDGLTLCGLARIFRVSLKAMLTRIQSLTSFGFFFGIPVDMNALKNLEYGLEQLGMIANKRLEKSGKLKRRIQHKLQQKLITIDKKNSDCPDNNVTSFTKELLTQLGLVGDYRNGKLMLDRPLVFEFSGSPKAGKDTQIEILVEYLTDILNLKVKVINEGVRDAPRAVSPVYKLLGMVGTILQNLSWTVEQPKVHDVVIINRGVFDALAFIKFFVNNGHLSKTESKWLRSILVCDDLTSLVDVVFYLTVPPKISISREKQKTRDIVSNLAREFDPLTLPNPPQNIMNEFALKQLDQCYEEVIMDNKDKFNLVRIDDIDESSIEEVAFRLIANIKRLLPKRRADYKLEPLVKEKTRHKPENFQLVLPGLEKSDPNF